MEMAEEGPLCSPVVNDDIAHAEGEAGCAESTYCQPGRYQLKVHTQAYSTIRFRLVNAFIEMTFKPETQTEAKRNVVTPPRTLGGMARNTPLILARTP